MLAVAAWAGVAAQATTVTCQGDTPPPFYKYEVRPNPGESISFFRVETEDRNAADGSHANFIQPSGWPDPKVSDGYLRLPDKPNDAHLKYAWFDKPGKPGDPDDPKDPDPSPDLKLLQLAVSTVPTTCHDIDPIKLGVWYPSTCKRTQAPFLLDEGDGDGARFCFEPFELQARAHCPSPRLPVEGRDLKFDGLARSGYGFAVDPAADADADGLALTSP